MSALRRSRRPALPHRLLVLLGVCLAALAALGALGAPAVALAAHRPATRDKVVRYDGYAVTVPRSWPVFRLTARSRTCVRFNRHAVYLGTPGPRELCPVAAIGRTEAVLISPRRARARARAVLTPASTAGAARGDGSVARLVSSSGRVVVTATWNRHPALIRAALGLSSLSRAARATNGHRPAAARASGQAAEDHGLRSAAVSAGAKAVAADAATPGEVYTGLGFDACSAPSSAALSAWSSSPFRAVGIYIGGTNMACSQSNLDAAWVSGESALGWHMIPIYVGLQAPTSGCGCATIAPASAATEGAAAAADAVAQAEALGLGAGNPIYFDMENYTRTTAATGAVLAFLQAWTSRLHDAGYLSGVYSSADSGIADLVAEDGSGYVEPDDIWIADWNNQQSTADSHVPSTEWATDQRLHQFEGGHTDDYGGTKINIDGDYMDGATAAAGAGSGTVTTTTAAAPSITVAPQANGAVDLTPSWPDETGVHAYEILAGSSPTTLAAVRTVSPGRRTPVVMNDAYPYFQVEALDTTGQVIASSAATPLPSRPAIFGQSAFVPATGPGGVPVSCLNAPFCRVKLTIHDGTRVIAHSSASIPATGGIVHFSLTRRAHQLVAEAPGGRLPVTVAVRSSNGVTTKRSMALVPFAVSGAAPPRSAGASATVRVVGQTDFVARGWTGGILAACTAAAPCATTLRVTSDSGTVIATSKPQTLGVGEVGYLSFTLTAAGHRLIHAAAGHQIGVRIQVTTGASNTTATAGAASLVSAPAATATARVALADYGNR